MDPLSDVLSLLRPRSYAASGFSAGGDWSVRFPRHEGIKCYAVVADHWWEAKVALDALPITWDEGENAKVSSASIAEWLKAGLDAPEAFVGNSNGDAKAALASAARKVEAVYAYPYQNHACMEPLNATALYTEN